MQSFPRDTVATRRLLRLLLGAAVVSVLAVAPETGRAESPPRSSAMGNVRYIYHGLAVQPPHQPFRKGKQNMPVYSQYFLRTLKVQRASIRFNDRTTLHINQRTDLILRSPNMTVVKKGEVDQVVAPGTKHNVRTASAVASAIGTNFLVRVVKGGSIFIVVEGALQVKNPQGTVIVKTNEETQVVNGKGPSPPTQVNAQQSVGWTSSMPSPNLPTNIALDANGGTVVGFSSEYSNPIAGDFWRASFINDGRRDYGWESATGQITNQWVKIKLPGTGTYTITSVVIDPAATHNDATNADLKDFQIRVSTASANDADFKTVLTDTAQSSDSMQRFTLSSPADAKYVELYALNNYGDPDWLAVAEFAVYGKPAGR